MTYCTVAETGQRQDFDKDAQTRMSGINRKIMTLFFIKDAAYLVLVCLLQIKGYKVEFLLKV